ncbi:hypothetical protein A4E84_29765 [Streptomyces qaidamensis]|uniref:DUF3168 domain-containing protein n=1 Tax=Streptomyces qaidamensis TaxID=1783515 RepID=A0A143C8N0_9ACTN|nr:hypothetical protein [Streptomyces qaidamensis]AMW13315.1 hypothetical protein A4E84_29765 [Streptomyces qaidamensis]
MPYPSTELVATAWLQQVPDMQADVGTELPKDPTTWPDGFVQVMTVGGTPGIHLPMRRPVVQVDCWAATPGSPEPPWGLASHLGALILAATYTAGQRLTELPDLFGTVRVQSAYAVSEPRRIPSDEARFARVQFDLQLHWSAA